MPKNGEKFLAIRKIKIRRRCVPDFLQRIRVMTSTQQLIKKSLHNRDIAALNAAQRFADHVIHRGGDQIHILMEPATKLLEFEWYLHD